MANPEYQRRFQINQVGADDTDGMADLFKTDGNGRQYVLMDNGMYLPKHNKQVITEVSSDVTTIEYYDVTTLLATKTITVSGSVTTIEMVYE